MAAALERLIGGHQPKGVGPYEAFLGAPKCHPRFVGAASATRKRRGQCVTDAELARAVRARPSRTLRRDLAARSKCKETDERCILEAAGTVAAKELLAQAFRPAKPAEWDSDPDQWLNNEIIEQFLQQYADI